ncbi:hypothetical protein L2E82_46369 [Cichorium intybus]|uniref:Uncharacterized protein n=1 Tax=Cichorium intybus TaxID=13427 RepID=A0ACB8YT34_CICIN|nr:hypothetical protein L2E82_46369 [Cichorium intybus]
MASKTTTAREHVEEIRRTKFSIGGEPNPLTEDLHQAVKNVGISSTWETKPHSLKNLSAELYAKDVHFLMELIQNAEDNEYPEGVDPSLEFVITSKDITNTGAPATFLNIELYAKCIGSSNLVMGVSEDVYIQLLLFISENWGSCFHKTNIKNTPLIKYIERDGNVDVFTPVSGTNKLLATDSDHKSWLINWNTEFRCATGKSFLPKVTQEAIQSSSKKPTLVKWLKEELQVNFVSVCEYTKLLSHLINSNRKMAVTYSHFLHNSLKNDYLSKHEVEYLCKGMPIVDNYGQVTRKHSEVLVPANGSRWVELIGSNPWRQHNYVELGEDYARSMTYFGDATSGEELVSFLKTYVGASDVPNLSPPNAAIPTLSAPLTKRNTFLLLQWLRNLRMLEVSLPKRFLSSIKNGSWLKVSLSGSPGYRPPSESFMLKSSIGNLLQNGSVLVDIPLVDENFYGDEMKNYKDELKRIGVRFQDTEACKFIGDRAMSLAASSKLARDNVLLILKFIRYLGVHHISPGVLISSITNSNVNWLRTSRGYMTPSNSVLFSQEWNVASQISDIPFLDQDYYGKEILDFKKELGLLGVLVNFNYQLVLDNLKSSSSLTSLSSEALYKLHSSYQNLGYKCPSECFLLNPESEWSCLLKVFKSFPVLDEQFYGSSIFLMANELKKIGVKVDFEDAIKEFTRTFKQHASLSSLKKEHVLSFLQCYRKLKKLETKFSAYFNNCIRKKEWLRTILGDYRPPNECILFGTDWEPISQISILPFIDDGDNCYGSEIHEYRAELKRLGVVTDFKNGAKFVASGLFLPRNSSRLTPANICALLDCVKELKDSKTDFPDQFLEEVTRKRWLKTHFGYKRPDECLLFGYTHVSLLKHNDGPFVCEAFYGSSIGSYKDELDAIGVINDINKECQLLASYLNCHTNFETITRIYIYLSTSKWEPADEDNTKIWIPKKNISDVDHAHFEPVNLKETMIKKGLFKLILAFLADPNLKLEPDKRHEAVSRVLAIEAFETPEKMTVRYRLTLSCGDVMDVEPRRMIRWDKQQSKLYMQKMDRSLGHKNVMEYAFHFAEEIAEGVLWEKEELVGDLSEPIRLGYLAEFDDETVEFLMKIKNLQIFLEDQDYLSSTFSS